MNSRIGVYLKTKASRTTARAGKMAPDARAAAADARPTRASPQASPPSVSPSPAEEAVEAVSPHKWDNPVLLQEGKEGQEREGR